MSGALRDLVRSDCWRLRCDSGAEVNIVGENNEFPTSVCESCASEMVDNWNWRYADG